MNDPLLHFDSPQALAWANAVEAENLPRLRELAAAGPAPSSAISPLAWAHRLNRAAAFAELLRLGIPPDASAIEAVLLDPDPRYTQLLLTSGWRPAGHNPHGDPWLFTPLLARNHASFRLLAEHGAPLDAPRPCGLTPLIALVSLHQFELAFWLLERGADPAPATSTGATAASRTAASRNVPPDQSVWRARVAESLNFRGFTAQE